MISTSPYSSPTDQETKRRQALAKVYSLLIRLAEEQETLSRPSEIAPNEGTSEESTSSSAEVINHEICVLEIPETLNSDTSSEPLQNNIPPEV